MWVLRLWHIPQASKEAGEIKNELSCVVMLFDRSGGDIDTGDDDDDDDKVV